MQYSQQICGRKQTFTILCIPCVAFVCGTYIPISDHNGESDWCFNKSQHSTGFLVSLKKLNNKPKLCEGSKKANGSYCIVN